MYRPEIHAQPGQHLPGFFGAEYHSVVRTHHRETFPRITAHGLRHTAASLAISAGANPKVVQRMLRHASAAMTLDVYADLFDSDLDSVAENVAKMWPRAGQTAADAG